MLKFRRKEICGNKERELYISDKLIEPMTIVEAMENSDFPVKEVVLEEEADVGFYYFGGSYSVEKAKELYPKVKDDVKYVVVRLKYGCEILIKEDSMVVSYPSQINFNIKKYLK